ncbi:MAG: cation transporter [Bacteroidota bacterium]
MSLRTLKILGMSCDHCVMHVKKELSKVADVKDVQIGSAVVIVDDQKVKADDLRAAVAAAGYEVTDIS